MCDCMADEDVYFVVCIYSSAKSIYIRLSFVHSFTLVFKLQGFVGEST